MSSRGEVLRQVRWPLLRTKCRPGALATRTESRDTEIQTGLGTSTKPARLSCPAVQALAMEVAVLTAHAARAPPRGPGRARRSPGAEPPLATSYACRTPP